MARERFVSYKTWTRLGKEPEQVPQLPVRERFRSQNCLLFDTQGLINSQLKESFDALPPDRYIQGDYPFRFRTHGQGIAIDGRVDLSDNFPFRQSAQVNSYAGDIDRQFEPLDEATKVYAEKELIPFLLSFLPKADSGYAVHVHPIRITADAQYEGFPAPEGEHQDEVDYEALVCVARENTKGALTTIYRPPLPFPRKAILQTTLQPGDILIYDDSQVSHYTTSIRPQDPAHEAKRDLFVVTFTRLKETDAVEYQSFVNKDLLAARFIDDLRNRKVSPEQYFVQNVDAVRALYAPEAEASYTEPSAEEALLNKHLPEILGYVDSRSLVFWGAGRKEARLVNAVPETSRAVVIDIEPAYIADMADLIDPSKRAGVKGMIALFQSFLEDEQREFLKRALDEKPAFHACFGTTIGNFNQQEIFSIFQNNTQAGDYLMLGFQLEKDPEKILPEYRDDELFQRVVRLPFLVDLEEKGIGLHNWRYNYDEHQIEYWFEFTRDFASPDYPQIEFKAGETIEVGRSKKYDLSQLVEELKDYDLQYATHFEEDDHCLLLLQKTKDTT